MISNENGSQYFRVEEYKRPKFEVKFDPVKGSYSLNDKVTVEGFAKTYSGANLNDVDVKYRVVRTVYFPYYDFRWRWYYNWFWGRYNEMEITNGVTTTDKEGKFKVEFELIPDLSMPKETKPVFSYTVYADIIDVTGETHSAQTYVSAGYVALVANINIPEIVKSHSIVKYQVSTTNLNGQFEPAPISIEVYRLNNPDRIFRNRLWSKPDKFLITHDLRGTPRRFEIKLGESTYDITNRLQGEGLIGDADLLRDYLIYTGLDMTIQAGNLTLTPHNSPIEIAQALQDATPNEVTFRILPGWRMEEIAAALPTSGLSFSPQTFMEAARRPPVTLSLPVGLPPGASLEGFLFPDSYRLARAITIQDFIKTALDDFQAKVSPDIIGGFQNHNLSLFQAVALASIVQREAIVDEEMPMIASVFINRLFAGMRLDSDPTVQYALGRDLEDGTWWKSPLSLDDLEVNSSYNT